MLSFVNGDHFQIDFIFVDRGSIMRIGIFYSGSTGNTALIAKRLSELVNTARLYPIADAVRADLEAYDLLILGTSSWHDEGVACKVIGTTPMIACVKHSWRGKRSLYTGSEIRSVILMPLWTG